MREFNFILILLLIVGCETLACPPWKNIVRLNDEQANQCNFYCANATDEFYQCPQSVIDEAR